MTRQYPQLKEVNVRKTKGGGVGCKALSGQLVSLLFVRLHVTWSPIGHNRPYFMIFSIKGFLDLL